MWEQVPFTGTMVSAYEGAIPDVYAFVAKTTLPARTVPRGVCTSDEPS